MTLLAALPSSASAQEASNLCEDYATQQEAQAAFDRKPDRMWELDDDGDGIACEHLPSTSGDGASVFPWIAGGVLVIGAAAGTMIARRRTMRPEPAPDPQGAAGIYPEYDPELELELQLLEAERDAEQDTPDPGPAPMSRP